MDRVKPKAAARDKTADRATVERERRLNLALRASRFHTWTFDVRGHRLSIAETLCAALGASRAQCARPGSWRHRVHIEDRPRVEQAFRECLDSGHDLDVEFRIVLASGAACWLWLRATLIADGSTGNHLYGICADITERRADEERLRDSTRVEGRLYQRDREFKTLVENAPDVIARLDPELRYLYINRAVETSLGMVPDAFVGRTGAELGLPTSMLAATSAAARGAFSSGREQPASFEMEAPGTDGALRHFSARVIPEFDRHGHVDSVLMILYDVTERVRSQREREQLLAAERAARERAEAAARARDQFLAIVSHELRSPLNGIQNWTSVLERQIPADAPAISLRALAGIKNGVDQQVRLIEDLLDATRIMSGNLSLSASIVEVQPVIEAAVASVTEAAASRNIELLCDLHLGSERVRADPDRIQQIVWNLLSNALKFTSSGGHVRVSLERIGASVRLQVTDDGKGIDAKFLPRMFDWFRRDETSSQRGQDGLGLGLALVRHLCELHGGHVFATSPGPGLGSSFEVWLPLLAQATTPEVAAPADLSSTAPPDDPSLAGLRVIVIDDQQDALEAMSALLSSMAAQVWTFNSAREVMDWLERKGAQRKVDVVICDIAMPGQDGYDTLALIRAHEKKLGLAESDRLRVIALTAFAQREDRQRALDAGFAMHMAKPVCADELAAAVLSVARGSHPPHTNGKRPSEPATEPPASAAAEKTRTGADEAARQQDASCRTAQQQG